MREHVEGTMQPENEQNRLLIDVQGACRLLSVSRTTLYSLVSAGLIRPKKIGRKTTFRFADLQAFAASEDRAAA